MGLGSSFYRRKDQDVADHNCGSNEDLNIWVN